MPATQIISYGVAERLAKLQHQITNACSDCQPARTASEVTLLAVGKKQPDKLLQAAYQAGVLDFGENYVQEIVAKHERLQLPKARWHLIGPLQSNKTSETALLCSWVHSINRFKIANRLSLARAAARLPPLKVCVQVNLGSEQAKSGVSIDKVAELCHQIVELPALELCGLMCIPEIEVEAKLRFAQLRELRDQIRTPQLPLSTLSMGMSSDFVSAIHGGSTIVRVGTALFGSRKY